MSSLLARMRSKPKQSDDNGQVEAAVAKLKDARRFDDSKQYSTAVMLYEEGLRLLIERANVENDEPKRAVILKTVEEYMPERSGASSSRRLKNQTTTITVRSPGPRRCLHENRSAARPRKLRDAGPRRRRPFKLLRTSCGTPSRLECSKRCSTGPRPCAGRMLPVSKRRS